MNDSNRKKIMKFDTTLKLVEEVGWNKEEYYSTNSRLLVGIAKLMIDYKILADFQHYPSLR